MVVIRQSTIRTTLATGSMVVAFLAMGTYGLFHFDPDRGRTTAIALLVVAGLLALVSVRSIMRGALVAVLRSAGLEIRVGHFAGWGLIRWDDVDEVFLFRSVGLRMIGLRLADPDRYLRRSPAWTRWSLWLDRYLAVGADAYIPSAAAGVAMDDLARLMRLFQHSPATRERFGRDDIVLEFPTDVSLADVMKGGVDRQDDDDGVGSG